MTRTRMKQYNFKIGLWVTHPSIDPDRITEALRRRLKRVSRAGAPRTTSNGDPLTGTYDQTSWLSGSLREGEWDGYAGSRLRLDDAIDAVLRDLAEHKCFF